MKIIPVLLIVLGTTIQLAVAQTNSPISTADTSKDIWHNSNLTLLHLSELRASPDKYNGKTFIISGFTMQVKIGQGSFSKIIYFAETPNDATSGRAMLLFFDDYYAKCATTPEGRAKIRELSGNNESHYKNYEDMIANMASYTVIATVREFSDTFQPYLVLIDIRPGLLNDALQLKTSSVNDSASVPAASQQLEKMEAEAHAHPANVQNLLMLGGAYIQMERTNEAVALFDQAITNSAIKYNDVAALAQLYSKLGYGYLDKLEVTLQKLVTLAPDPVRPEACYDLAALDAVMGKTADALDNLRIAMDLNAKRLQSNPKANDLAAFNRSDQRFDSLRSQPEFQKIVPLK